MLVVVYLLEDEQELSLGMLIRPKRIYNICLLHASFVLYCYDIDELPYTFDHIWTNLLTQCTPVPVPVFCCFSISVFPHIESSRKIRENSDKKISVTEALRRAREGPEGSQGAQAATRRGPTPGRTRGAPRAPGPPLAAPLLLFIPRHGKTPEEEPYSANSPMFRRRRASKIGSTRRPLPGTLPEGGLTSGSLLSTMDAPRMSRE